MTPTQTDRSALLDEALAARKAAAWRRTRSNILWFVVPFFISAYFVFKDGMPASLGQVMDARSSGVGAMMMVFCALVGPYLIPKMHKTMMSAPVDNAIPALIGRRVAKSIRSDMTLLRFEELADIGVDRAPLVEVGMLPGCETVTFSNAIAGVVEGRQMALMAFHAPQPGRDPWLGAVLWVRPDGAELQRVHIKPTAPGEDTPLADPRFALGKGSTAPPDVIDRMAAAVSAFAGEDDARARNIAALTVGEKLVLVHKRDRPLFDLEGGMDSTALTDSIRQEVFRACDAVKALP